MTMNQRPISRDKKNSLKIPKR